MLQQMKSSLEQQPMLHFSKMGFPVERDPSSCTRATMWFLVPKRVCRGRYNTILSQRHMTSLNSSTLRPWSSWTANSDKKYME